METAIETYFMAVNGDPNADHPEHYCYSPTTGRPCCVSPRQAKEKVRSAMHQVFDQCVVDHLGTGSTKKWGECARVCCKFAFLSNANGMMEKSVRIGWLRRRREEEDVLSDVERAVDTQQTRNVKRRRKASRLFCHAAHKTSLLRTTTCLRPLTRFLGSIFEAEGIATLLSKHGDVRERIREQFVNGPQAAGAAVSVSEGIHHHNVSWRGLEDCHHCLVNLWGVLFCFSFLFQVRSRFCARIVLHHVCFSVLCVNTRGYVRSHCYTSSSETMGWCVLARRICRHCWCTPIRCWRCLHSTLHCRLHARWCFAWQLDFTIAWSTLCWCSQARWHTRRAWCRRQLVRGTLPHVISLHRAGMPTLLIRIAKLPFNQVDKSCIVGKISWSMY